MQSDIFQVQIIAGFNKRHIKLQSCQPFLWRNADFFVKLIQLIEDTGIRLIACERGLKRSPSFLRLVIFVEISKRQIPVRYSVGCIMRD
ncbi:hypothetical protein D3C78_1364640 [compost metagenome]